MRRIWYPKRRFLVIILVLVLPVTLSILVPASYQEEDQESTGNSQETPPSAIFLTKNVYQALTNNSTTEDVCCIILAEGYFRINEVMLLISDDDDRFFEYPIRPECFKPNNPPLNEWNAGEGLYISEHYCSLEITSNSNGNWPATEISVRIISRLTNKMIYQHQLVIKKLEPRLESVGWLPDDRPVYFQYKPPSVTLTNKNTSQDLWYLRAGNRSFAINDLTVLVSSNAYDFFEYPIHSLTLTPNNPPENEWNPGEVLTINECFCPAQITNASNGNWPGTIILIHIIFETENTIIYGSGTAGLPNEECPINS